MIGIEALKLRVRRRETPTARALYRLAKAYRSAHVPVIRPLHLALYYEREARLSLWRTFLKAVYHEPLFRARCERVGERLRLTNGIPYIEGHLVIRLGDDVAIDGVSSLIAAKVHDRPVFEVGDRVFLGHQLTVSVAERVTIGSDVLVSDRVMIADNDGHPLDPARRAAGHPVAAADVRPVRIEDGAWIGTRAVILKGVTVGRGAVVASGSVVTRDVPPYSVVAGNPARVVRRDCRDGAPPEERAPQGVAGLAGEAR
ncbi:MAG TPA: acyltransferase [Thermodesulfobacteriota bacterium]